MYRVAVIGGGAAGLMAAGLAAQNGCQVTLFEKNAKVGRKLAITGKGRCNVTNACDVDTFMRNIPRNSRFLYSAVVGFDTQAAQDFFEGLDVPLKVERGSRVFPVSDRATDIVDALFRFVKREKVKLIFQPAEKILAAEGEIKGVAVGGRIFPFDAVILATGGVSYPGTGSTGDGYRFARELGHTVISPKPSLVPLCAKGEICPRLQGLSLKNVEVTIWENDKKKYEDFGEMMFTHFGVTGPVILSASAHMRDFENNTYALTIDLKPALDEKTLDKRILSDFHEKQNSDFINALGKLLPKKLIPVAVDLSGIPAHEKVNSITRQQRENFVRLLKRLRIEIVGPRPIEEAIVTSGGISVKEISPKTMESKLVKGLYFAGEIIDVDGYTGGFNLQIAWSTGCRAGISAGSVGKNEVRL